MSLFCLLKFTWLKSIEANEGRSITEHVSNFVGDHRRRLWSRSITSPPNCLLTSTELPLCSRMDIFPFSRTSAGVLTSSPVAFTAVIFAHTLVFNLFVILFVNLLCNISRFSPLFPSIPQFLTPQNSFFPRYGLPLLQRKPWRHVCHVSIRRDRTILWDTNPGLTNRGLNIVSATPK